MSNANQFAVMTVRCSGPSCEHVRKDANHWFLCRVIDGMFICEPYDPKSPLSADHHPVCGQACAQKKLETYLATKGL